MLRDMVSPYTVGEAWFYDRFIAPAAASMAGKLMDDLLERVPQGASVLEVGSGGGQLAVDVAERRRDLRWQGVDQSPAQVARAARRARHVGARVAFRTGDALDLPFCADRFDVVCSVASIKHWPDRHRGLKECVRVLRPGGLLAIVEADRGCRHEDARDFVDLWRIPRALRPIALAFFRTAVAGRSLDLDDARALLEPLPLDEREARRLEGAPVLAFGGRKG